jgi:hypothetical protein
MKSNLVSLGTTSKSSGTPWSKPIKSKLGDNHGGQLDELGPAIGRVGHDNDSYRRESKQRIRRGNPSWVRACRPKGGARNKHECDNYGC